MSSNRSRIATTVVCLVTSNMERAKAPGNLALTAGSGGLLKSSVVNISQILTIDKTGSDERIGHLPGHTLEAVRAGLRLLLEIG